MSGGGHKLSVYIKLNEKRERNRKQLAAWKKYGKKRKEEV